MCAFKYSDLLAKKCVLHGKQNETCLFPFSCQCLRVYGPLDILQCRSKGPSKQKNKLPICPCFERGTQRNMEKAKTLLPQSLHLPKVHQNNLQWWGQVETCLALPGHGTTRRWREKPYDAGGLPAVRSWQTSGVSVCQEQCDVAKITKRLPFGIVTPSMAPKGWKTDNRNTKCGIGHVSNALQPTIEAYSTFWNLRH